MWSPSRLSISRRRVPGPRAASASAAVSTHSRGPPCPRAARTLFLTHLLACHVSDRAPFSLQTPVERSERLAGCWAVRARANPLSLGVWHFTLRFVLPWSRVGYPRPQRPKGKAGECSHPLDPKSTQSLPRAREPAQCLPALAPWCLEYVVFLPLDLRIAFSQ